MRIIFEKVRESDGSSFACRSIAETGFLSPLHVHPEVEILQIAEGSGHLVVGDHIGRFEAGDLMLFGSDLPHMVYSDVSLGGDCQPTRLRYVQLRPAAFGTDVWAMPEMRAMADLLRDSRRGLRFSRQTSAAAVPLFDGLLATVGLTRLAELFRLFDLLTGDTSRLEMASIGYAGSGGHQGSERLDRAIRFINEHLAEDIGVEAVASIAGLSPQTFSRVFHKTVGVSCIGYIVALRIGLACRHLLETDDTITAIAFKVGFNNLSNFNRLFRKYRHMTPADYRRHATQGQAGRQPAEA